ncbi:MAG TPA: hypothetical protein VLL75_16365 [Vicinamibacteria bacterium]|nr:hypothetical protein [Vicinamibacteria bacterium]
MTIPLEQDVALWLTRLDEGDAAALSDEPAVRLVGRGGAEVLLFDLA